MTRRSCTAGASRAWTGARSAVLVHTTRRLHRQAVVHRHVLRGHRDAVNAVCVRGASVYSASRDGTLRGFDLRCACDGISALTTVARSGACLRVYVGHASTVRACAVDAGNMRLVSGGKDATIRCHDTQSGQLLWFSDGHSDYINCMLIRGHALRRTACHHSHTDQAVFTSGRDGSIRAWHLDNGAALQLYASPQSQADASVRHTTSCTPSDVLQRAPMLRLSAEALVIASGFMQFMSFSYVVNFQWESSVNIFGTIAPPVQLNLARLKVDYFAAAFWCAINAVRHS